jgi:hypothetical protein
MSEASRTAGAGRAEVMTPPFCFLRTENLLGGRRVSERDRGAKETYIALGPCAIALGDSKVGRRQREERTKRGEASSQSSIDHLAGAPSRLRDGRRRSQMHERARVLLMNDVVEKDVMMIDREGWTTDGTNGKA